jgi:hypothetical protein
MKRDPHWGSQAGFYARASKNHDSWSPSRTSGSHDIGAVIIFPNSELRAGPKFPWEELPCRHLFSWKKYCLTCFWAPADSAEHPLILACPTHPFVSCNFAVLLGEREFFHAHPQLTGWPECYFLSAYAWWFLFSFQTSRLKWHWIIAHCDVYNL